MASYTEELKTAQRKSLASSLSNNRPLKDRAKSFTEDEFFDALKYHTDIKPEVLSYIIKMRADEFPTVYCCLLFGQEKAVLDAVIYLEKNKTN
jgi:hypothetical protein